VKIGDLERGITLVPGEHLMIPVSGTAEQRLSQLGDLLDDMGPDVKALVLHTLRSPSLDTRVALLEVKLSGSGACRRSGPLARVGRWWNRKVRAALWRLPHRQKRWIILALVGLNLAAGLLLGVVLYQQRASIADLWNSRPARQETERTEGWRRWNSRQGDPYGRSIEGASVPPPVVRSSQDDDDPPEDR
jgi:hypothetical protein